MIEHAVQHDLDIMLVECLADLLKVLVRPETTVDLQEISRVISMVVRFEDRIEKDRADAQFLEILCPFRDL